MVVAMFAWGTAFYGLGFYLLRLHDLRGWSRSSISNIFLVFYVAAVLLSFGVAKMLARRGPRLVIGGGALAAGGALVAMPHAGNLYTLTAVFLVLSVGWSGMNSNPISTTIMAWFPGGQRQLSTALVGASIGGIVLIPSLAWADERWGFATAVTALGVATIVCVGTVAVFVIDAPPGWTPVGAAPAVRASSAGGAPEISPAHRADRTAWFLLHRRDYWVVGVGLGLGVTVQGGFLVHQLSLLSVTLTDVRAAQVVGVAVFAALIGRLGPIVIGDRVAPALVGATYLLVQTLAMVGLAVFDHTPVVLTLMSMLYGLGVGVLITMPSLLTRVTYPDLPYTAAYPVVNLGFQVPLALGAPTLALLHDSFGGYRQAMWVLALADATAAMLFLVNYRTTATAPPL
jgi:hypothetical protein